MSSSPFILSIRNFMLARHYSSRTVKSYLYWIRYFIRYHKYKHPNDLTNIQIEEFLTFLAVERKVSTATQKLALNSLPFLYTKFLKIEIEIEIGDFSAFKRTKAARKLPVVLTRGEIEKLLAHLNGTPLLMLHYCMVLVCEGLRLSGCALRILILTSCNYVFGSAKVLNID